MITAMLLGEENSTNMFAHFLNNFDYITLDGVFSDPADLVCHIKNDRQIVVFIDIDCYPLYDLIKCLSKIKPHTELAYIVISSTGSYAAKAYEFNVIDYIVTPFSMRRFQKALEKIRTKFNYNLKTNSNEFNIYINCFGSFHVTKTGETDGKINWRTKKVKELFAYLLCNYDKKITKEELIINLFGKLGNDKEAQNNLYVTMSYLRKALGEFGIPRELLLINKDYSLQMKEEICDFVMFDRFIKENEIIDEHNIEKAIKIIQHYKGMLLDDEDYIWAFVLRQYCDKKFEDLLFLISDFYREHKNHKKYETFLLKVLTNNPMSIEANENLLNLYIEQHKKESFKRQYQKYKKIVIEEYNDRPRSKYAIIYNKIVNVSS